MPKMTQNFTEESWKPNRRITLDIKLFKPYEGYVRPILGQCFGYFYTVLASRCLKWFKFSLESYKPNRRIPANVKLFGPYKGHVLAILGPCFGYFYNIFASR